MARGYKTGRTLQAFRVAAPLTEGGQTWSNQPATAETAVTTPSGFGYRRSREKGRRVRRLTH